MFQKKSNSVLVGLVAYLLLTLGLPLLKLAGVAWLANTSWQKVTSLLWGPWLMLVAFAVVVVLVRLVQGARRV